MLLRFVLAFAFLFSLIQSLTLSKLSKSQPSLSLRHERGKPFLIELTRRQKTRKVSESLLEAKPQKKSAIQRPIANPNNMQYVGQIGIGSPDNLFRMLFDTGSTAFVVTSSLCTEADCVRHKSFDVKASKTLSLDSSDSDLHLNYGSGTFQVRQAKEDVYFDDLKLSQANIFLVESQQASDDTDFDGIFGLGPPNPNLTPKGTVVSLFESIIPQLPHSYFSLNLKRNNESGSYVLFGGFHEEDTASPLLWHKVVDETFWAVSIQNVYVGDKKLKTAGFKFRAVIDSGEPDMLFPPTLFTQLTSLVDASKCSNLSSLPNVTFEIGGHLYTITPQDYVAEFNANNETFYHSDGQDYASCGLQFHEAPDELFANGDPGFVLGDPFISRFYTVYDPKNQKIGFALQKGR